MYNKGYELGHLETYQISKTSARIRVSMDGFKPLIKDPLLEFDSGEELVVSLEYEDLKFHCATCLKLTQKRNLARRSPALHGFRIPHPPLP